MATYTYHTATGDVEIEVDEEWASILNGEDAEETNDERRHTRPDHKYAPGEPVPVSVLDPDDVWIGGECSSVAYVDIRIDLDSALKKLTELQRKCFIEVRVNERTQADVAAELDISRDSVKQAAENARKKLLSFFA